MDGPELIPHIATGGVMLTIGMVIREAFRWLSTLPASRIAEQEKLFAEHREINTMARQDAKDAKDAAAADTNSIAIGASARAATGCVAIGYQSLKVQTAGGRYNTCVGYQTGLTLTTGAQNVAIGYSAMAACGINTSFCIAVGVSALTSVTGVNNVAIGHYALSAATSSPKNIGIGYNAMAAVVGGSGQNIGIGDGVLPTLTSGRDNVIIGLSGDVSAAATSFAVGIGTGVVCGPNSVAMGYGAAPVNTGAVAIGYTAGTNGNYAIALGSETIAAAFSIAIGRQAIATNSCVAIGYQALMAQTAGTRNNVAIGWSAGVAFTVAANCTIIGYGVCGGTGTTPSNTTAVGWQACYSVNNTGISNTGIGYAALEFATSSPKNTAVGDSAFVNVSTGAGLNVGIGFACGPTLTTGNSNTLIGANSDTYTATTTAAVTVGSGAYGGTGCVCVGQAASVQTLVYGTAIGNTVVASGNYPIALGYLAVAGSNEFGLSPYTNFQSFAQFADDANQYRATRIDTGWITNAVASRKGLGILSAYSTTTSTECLRWSVASGGGTEVGVTGLLKLLVAGNGVQIKEGTNATMGLAALSSGTVTVSTTKVTASSRIFLTAQDGTINVGDVWVSARTGGTSFVITSSNVLDARNIAWWIVEPL